jgi:hypothetical protein
VAGLPAVETMAGGAKGYFANFISAKKLKNEFSLFYPSVSHSTDISPEIQGRQKGNPVAGPLGII